MHTVREHITNQAYGSKHSQRKVIWIAPYVRGPADGDVAAHLYKIRNRGR